MMIDKEEFKKFQQEQSLTTSMIISMNHTMIQDLIDEGYSLRSIYVFLKEKKGAEFGYRGFCRAWLSFNKHKKNREQVKQPQVKKPVVSSTKTQFFEHNASPTEEDLAKLIGECK